MNAIQVDLTGRVSDVSPSDPCDETRQCHRQFGFAIGQRSLGRPGVILRRKGGELFN